MKRGTESGRGGEGGECGQNESASILPLPVKASSALGGTASGETHTDVRMGGAVFDGVRRRGRKTRGWRVGLEMF